MSRYEVDTCVNMSIASENVQVLASASESFCRLRAQTNRLVCDSSLICPANRRHFSSVSRHLMDS